MRLRALMAGLLIGALAPFAGPAHATSQTAAADPTPVARDLGIAVTGTRLVWGEPAEVERDLDRIAASGATWLRFDVAWSQLSWAQGQTDWTRVDRVVAGARARNLKVLGILGTMAPWARPAGTPWNYGPRTDAERAAFAGFAQSAAARYSGQIDAWEVWNEPNLDQAWAPRPSVTDYRLLLDTTYPAIKRVAPRSVVISGGTGGAGSSADIDTWTWYSGIYAAGAQRFFDALGLHPYTDLTSGYGGEMRVAARIRNLMDTRGDSAKQMWATETGAPTEGSMAVAEADLPDLLRESVDSWQALPNHGPLFWYTISDTADATREGHFGLFRMDGTAKPAYTAMQKLASGTATSQSQVRAPGGWTALPAKPIAAQVTSAGASLTKARALAQRATLQVTRARAASQRAALRARQAAATAHRRPTTVNKRRAAQALVGARAADRALRGARARATSAAAALAKLQRLSVRPRAAAPSPLAASTLGAPTGAVVVLRSALSAPAGGVEAHVTLRTNGVLKAAAVIVAVRGADGSNHDIWLDKNVVLNGTQVFAGRSQAFAAGSYTYRVAYLTTDGVWTDLWPEQTLVVGSGQQTTGEVAVSQVSMSASSARVKGSFTLFTAGTIPVKTVIVAMRDAAGRGGFDALASFETTLSGYQTFFPSRTPLRPGTYTYRVAYQTSDGRWAEVAPAKTLVVS